MRGIEQRLEKLEEMIGDKRCTCCNQHAVAIVVVEPTWTQEQIRQAEADAAVTCPSHGRIRRPTLRLSGSDVDG